MYREYDEMFVRKGWSMYKNRCLDFWKKEICIQRGRILGISSSTLVEGLALYLAVADMSLRWVASLFTLHTTILSARLLCPPFPTTRPRYLQIPSPSTSRPYLSCWILQWLPPRIAQSNSSPCPLRSMKLNIRPRCNCHTYTAYSSYSTPTSLRRHIHR